MKWAITGGTGFVGKRLVEALRTRGDDVIVLTRNARRPNERAWTPEQPGPWQDDVKRADVVVHLAGAGVMDERWSEARIAELRSSRIESARLIAEAIASAPEGSRPRCFVTASAIGIFGMRKDDEVLDEDAPKGDDVLAEICKAWEAAAMRAPTRVLAARIGIVLGRGEGVLGKMEPAFRAFVGGPLGTGKQWVSWVHVDDVVRAILFAADDTKLPAGPFNLTAPTPVTMNELARTVGSVMHRPSIMRVPEMALAVGLGKERAEVATSGQRVVPRRLEAAGFPFAHPDLRHALENLLAT